jgi:16S rRNA (adenine1518-N6/adenine1519-N6)-dimethyltransferase
MIQAKKSFGQHFLHREDIAQRIADSLLQLSDTPRLLEIGPGRAMLTKYLLQKPNITLKVVEADRDMVAFLQANEGAAKGMLAENIIFKDFLQLDLRELFDGERFCVIGNFPYNISSQILISMLDHRDLVPEMVGMFQKEVAQRVVASEGSKTYGILSVLCQAFYDCKYLFSVDSGAFTPPPKVQSAVIRLTQKKDMDLGCDERLFRQVVKQAFGQRRKMLRNTVKPFFQNAPDALNEKYFEQRPEQLSLAGFIALTQRIEALRKGL